MDLEKLILAVQRKVVGKEGFLDGFRRAGEKKISYLAKFCGVQTADSGSNK
jgi:hypothetical protein